MKWQDLLSDAYGRIYQSLKMSLNGLTQEDLSQHPGEESNSMGWLAWHLTRVQDHHISALMDEDRLYLTEGWYAKFNRPAEPEDIGFGHSMETMASFTSIDAQHLVVYHKAVLDRTQSYLATLSPEELASLLVEGKLASTLLTELCVENRSAFRNACKSCRPDIALEITLLPTPKAPH